MEVVTIPSERREAPLTLSDFQFPLPPELIAQQPAARRDAARLLVLDRDASALTHRHVYDLPQALRPGDLLVVNDTRVMPARIFGRSAGGGAVELLLIRPRAQSTELRTQNTEHRAQTADWLCMGKPAKRLRVGTALQFGELCATVTEKYEDGSFCVAFPASADLQAFLAQRGELPLPPYIERPDGPLPFDRERYQTIFADNLGAIAAPTAGLHFTDALIDQLKAGGIGIASITLHVGPGTFRPIRTDDPSEHVMDPEWCAIPQATVDAIRRTKATGGRVIAVGTTTTRALESSLDANGELRSGAGWAGSYIRPGYRFRVIDCLFTNFHLPGSTLLLLVSALAGRDRILAAYAEAIRDRYRFYSYGDAMLIL